MSILPPGEFSVEHDVHEASSMGEFPVGLPEFSHPEHIRDIPKINTAQEIQRFQDLINFKPNHSKWQIAKDVIGLLRRMGGDKPDETYDEKRLLEEVKRGKSESATHGIGKVLGQTAVFFIMDWEYFAGSAGVVAGEHFQAAADLACDKKLPFIGVYASSGVRQHENMPGLVQMTRGVFASSDHLDRVKKPQVSVLIGNVWGGVSASVVPSADLIVATEGTRYGFAGPKVIETYEGRKVPYGTQSAEANLIDRNIEVMVPNTEALIPYLGKLLVTARQPNRRHNVKPQESHVRNVTAPDQGRVFGVGERGIAHPLLDMQEVKQRVTVPFQERKSAETTNQDQDTIDKFQELIRGAGRIDAEFIIENGFDSAVPLYNHIVESGKSASKDPIHFDIKRYPATIGAIAKIGNQPFLVVGSQPSYKIQDGRVSKIPASPGPEDFEYVERLLEMGERLKLPAVFITDSLGAEPSLANEHRGQSRAISDLIKKGVKYKYPVISLISGALGSGGGLATTPLCDSVLMVERSLGFVAEPRSAASILYKVANPSIEQVTGTLTTMRATAQDQLELGLIHGIVPESPNPYQTVESIRNAIIENHSRLSNMSHKSLHNARKEYIRNLRGFVVDKQ